PDSGGSPGKRGSARRALIAFTPLAGVLVVPLLNLALTGHAASSTAQVKWLVESPYHHLPGVAAASLDNPHLLLSSLLNGGDWTVIFPPEHANGPILLGAATLPVAAVRRRVPWHAAFVAALVLGSFVPCTYGTFLWNRLRYVWPFAPGWFVLAACLTREVGDLARLVRPRLTALTPLLAGGFAALLGVRLPWAVHDLAQSAS